MINLGSDLIVTDMAALSAGQFAALARLKVTPRQEVLGKSFAESIADWSAAQPDEVLGLCFLLSQDPVGLALFKRRPDLPGCAVSIHGLKIAIPWQRRGLGHAAFQGAVACLMQTWPEIQRLHLAVDAENQPAIAVYRAYGMLDSGPVFQGPNGLEHRMEIDLNQGD